MYIPSEHKKYLPPEDPMHNYYSPRSGDGPCDPRPCADDGLQMTSIEQRISFISNEKNDIRGEIEWKKRIWK